MKKGTNAGRLEVKKTGGKEGRRQGRQAVRYVGRKQ